jgi:sterol desaturase/sphingolipid hydroxylase (fatty acid hydroxylase superfamily)
LNARATSPTNQRYEIARQLFRWTAFPVTLALSLWVASIVWARTGDLTQAFVIPSTGAALFILLLERIFPFRSQWNTGHGDTAVDVAHFFSVQATSYGAEIVITALLVPAAIALRQHAALSLWPSGLPVFADLALALVVAEFPKYWVHRKSHEWDWLWRFHSVHHSVPRLYWFNAYRFHPVDIGLDTMVGLGVVALLGCRPEVLALFAVVTAVHGFFQHSNLDLRLGPLNWVFSMAELHRWHHSRVMDEANNNYGNNLIVWDIVFGTRYLPTDREPPIDIGLSGLSAFPQTFVGQLLAPVTWKRIREASIAAESAARHTKLQ